LFLVELSDALAEAETLPADPASLLTHTSTEAPATYLNDQLRSLILARIDALDDQARRVMHIAAVLGYAFPASLLRRMLGHGDLAPVLARLEDHGLLLREARRRHRIDLDMAVPPSVGAGDGVRQPAVGHADDPASHSWPCARVDE
jgi:hypothetical protein